MHFQYADQLMFTLQAQLSISNFLPLRDMFYLMTVWTAQIWLIQIRLREVSYSRKQSQFAKLQYFLNMYYIN